MTESQAEIEAVAPEAATTTRRAMLVGASALGASTVLAACGTDDGTSLAGGTGGAANNTGTSPTASSGSKTGDTEGANNTTGNGGAVLTKTSDIPEGGGKVFKAQSVVVTQPKAGTFKAFSSVCTHAGCTVGPVEDGVIKCQCHGSQFSIEDGSVKHGPATQELSGVKLKTANGSISLA